MTGDLPYAFIITLLLKFNLSILRSKLHQPPQPRAAVEWNFAARLMASWICFESSRLINAMFNIGWRIFATISKCRCSIETIKRNLCDSFRRLMQLRFVSVVCCFEIEISASVANGNLWRNRPMSVDCMQNNLANVTRPRLGKYPEEIRCALKNPTEKLASFCSGKKLQQHKHEIAIKSLRLI